MTKAQILCLKELCRLDQNSLYDFFAVACEDAYAIRCDSAVAPMVQCRIRASHLAFPLTAMLLDLTEVLGGDRQ